MVKSRPDIQASHLLLVLFFVLQTSLSLAAANWWVTNPIYRPCDLRHGNQPSVRPGELIGCEAEADYIVVGGGAGGAAMASKLSDDQAYSVLLMEAGFNAENDPNVYDPFKSREAANVQTSTYDWQMKTAPVRILGRPLDISIGRMLGGATSHNAMFHTYPSPAYAAQWEALGFANWTVAAIYDAYQRMEKHNMSLPDRGTTGPVSVKRSPIGPTTGTGAFVYKMTNWVSQVTGFPILPDYNSKNSNNQGPFYRFDFAVNENGQRESSSRAFLGPNVMSADGKGVGARKLRVFFRTTVTRVIFDQFKRARGVEYLYEGRTQRAWARKEIILSASLFSTQILQNSGIGNQTFLESMGIDVVYHNPNVGRNLANHPLVSVPYIISSNDAPTFLPDHSGFCSGIFLPQWYANNTYSNAEVNGTRKYQIFWLYTGVNAAGQHTAAAATVLQTPRSRGTEFIQSSDPLQVPLHDEKMFFDDPSDLDDFVAQLYYFHQGTLLPKLQAEDPTYQSGWGVWNSLAECRAWLIARVATGYHYNGQNRMSATAATGVVNPKGEVHGVTRLSVADSTIFPTCTDGNTAGPTMMLGFRIAEFIIAKR